MENDKSNVARIMGWFVFIVGILAGVGVAYQYQIPTGQYGARHPNGVLGLSVFGCVAVFALILFAIAEVVDRLDLIAQGMGKTKPTKVEYPDAPSNP